MADQSYFSSNTPLLPSDAATQQQGGNSASGLFFGKLQIYHFLCPIYVLVVVAYAVQTATVSKAAVVSVVLAFFIQFGVIIWLAIKSGVPLSTVIGHFTIGSSLTSFIVLLCGIVIALACFGANLFNVLMFLSSFLASNPHVIPIIKDNLTFMIKDFITQALKPLLPAPLQKLMRGSSQKRSFMDLLNDLKGSGVPVISAGALGVAVGLSTLVFLGFLLCFLFITSLTYILKSTTSYKAPPRSSTQPQPQPGIQAAGIASLATMVAAVGLACSGGSTTASVLFLLVSLSDFATLLIVGLNLRSPALFWHCVFFAYISTLLRWGAPHWYFLPQLPIQASGVIVCVRAIFIGIGALQLGHLGRSR